MPKNLRVTAAAAAVGAAFAISAAPASASSTTLYGTGGSSIKNALQYLILKDYCAAGSITFYDNGTTTISNSQPGGSIYLISCTPSSTSGLTSGTIQIGYDASGGSWRAFATGNSALYTTSGTQSTANPAPIATVTPGTGTTQVNASLVVLGNTFAVTYSYGTTTRALVPGTDAVTFGLTDGENEIFLATTDNQPLVKNSWTTTSAGAVQIFTNFGTGTEYTGAGGFPQSVFADVLGIGASPKLYSALQADQIATGGLPATCVAGTTSVPAATCAPNISRAQYASIVGASGGALNTSLASLFTSIVPTASTFELARRDQGSGAQAASNVYFLNDGCSTVAEAITSPQLPIGSGGNVSYNLTSSGAQSAIIAAALSSGTGFALGVLSAEFENKWTGGSGFLKLDGAYPNVANAVNGRYGFIVQTSVHVTPGVTGDAATFAADLVNQTPGSAKVSESLYNYGVGNTGTGIVGIFSGLNANASYGNGNALCNGWQHL